MIVLCAATFAVTRKAMKSQAARLGRTAQTAVQHDKASSAFDREKKILTGVFAPGVRTYLRRVTKAGHWLTYLLCPPAVAVPGRLLPLVANLVGWAGIVLYSAWAFAAARRREWIGLGVAVGCGAVVVMWGRPVPRYWAPLAPLLVLGIWKGIDMLIQPARSSARRGLVRAAAGVLLGSTLLVNVAILAVNAYVARSARYAAVCLAGEYEEMLQIAAFLRGQGLRDGELAVDVQYQDINRRGRNVWAHRVLGLLTDREIRSGMRVTPASLADGSAAMQARREGVRFFLVRSDRAISRLWHFRVAPAGGAPQAEDGPYYVLYKLNDDRLAAVEDLPEISDGLRRVPGM